MKPKLNALLIYSIAASVFAAEHEEGNKNYSPYVANNYPRQVLFGDTHLHTAQSFDAIAFGTSIGPEQAYQFARGKEVISSSGMPAKLSRPLDFLVVADHAELMGVMGEVLAANPAVMGNKGIARWHEMLKAGGKQGLQVYYEMLKAAGFTDASEENSGLPKELTNKKMTTSIWQKNIKAAEKYNEPGEFTALIGYEWSSNEKGNNLHRVVIYRDGEKQTSQTLPFSALVSGNPEDLWLALKNYQEKTGGKVLAIPHNGNLSNGLMFPLVNPETGQPITKEYAKLRAEMEPIIEVSQIKGDGETHPKLSKNDEFADYETWDRGNLTLSADKKDEMLEFEYARSALKNGLVVESTLGINPFKFGMIGSTDSHTGLAAVEEENFFGKLPHAEPSDHRVEHALMKFGEKAYMGYEMTSSGYAAVWATENTREGIWDAMKRKEVYATTGPRMTVRFFGSWDFDQEDAYSNVIVKSGYSKGVPMGGDLTSAAKNESPKFLVSVLKDPIGANLDRVQIVKGWLDNAGKNHEKVYDVVCSDNRALNNNRCKTAVGNTVNVKNATWVNSIGDTEMVTLWQDPDFDSALKAFYYVRAIEIPTPRWTAYDAAYYEFDVSNKVKMTTQERAYTSPIWYTPRK